ncbi:ADAM family mig-17 [Mizuhopecten yessoensis]|uniref:ADAM family mig-17 n=1 Tax=Mizuhopecten yessoensis TaxID=6573 RepID=A0A210QTN4_MIZYE|nr:ADAM family mig-17 [Mizuhopecten yessoensis]
MTTKLLVWIVAGIALCSGFPSITKGTDKEEIVKIKLIFPKTDHDKHSKHKRSSDMFPETLSFRFRVNNTDVIMDLEKNTMASVPPIMRVDKLRPIYDTKPDIQRNFALYQGLGMGASALLRFPFDDISKFELHASYQHGSEWYAIEPLTLFDRRKRSSVPLHTVETMPTTQATTAPSVDADQLVADHKVTLLNPDIQIGSFFNDIIVIQDDQMTSTDNPLDPFPILRLGEEPYSIPMVDLHSFQNQRNKRQSTWDDWTPSERHRRKIAQKYVEYLVVLDYANFYKWHQVALGNTDDERYNNAVNSLVQYYLFVTNGIDVRFQSAQTSQGDLRVTLAGFVIATDKSESPWTENNKLTADAVYDGKSLEDFAKWINSQTASLPPHDHAALFTGHDLALSNKDTSTIGIAYLSRVCLSYSASVNQEPYNALSIHIAAHELGHSLGATHDASNSGSCSSALHYVMAPRLPAVNETLASNPYEFSSCSRSQIGIYLSKLGSDCLSNVPDILSMVTLTEKPGNVYPVDQQCHTLPEQDWVICRDKYVNYPLKWATICYQLECRRVGTSTCINRRQAYDGTPCGHMKIFKVF